MNLRQAQYIPNTKSPNFVSNSFEKRAGIGELISNPDATNTLRTPLFPLSIVVTNNEDNKKINFSQVFRNVTNIYLAKIQVQTEYDFDPGEALYIQFKASDYQSLQFKHAYNETSLEIGDSYILPLNLSEIHDPPMLFQTYRDPLTALNSATIHLYTSDGSLVDNYKLYILFYIETLNWQI